MYPFYVVMSDYGSPCAKHTIGTKFLLKLQVSFLVSRIGLKRIVADKNDTPGPQQPVHFVERMLLTGVRRYASKDCD